MLELRKYTLDDSELLLKYIGNEKVLVNLSDWVPNPYTLKDAQGFISQAIDNDNYRFAIEYNGAYCGGIGLDCIADNCGHSRSREIGFWLAEPFWNKGIMTLAVNMISEKGFEELDLVRIEANVFSYNKASMRVLEKCGFKKEGIQIKGAIKNGKIFDSHKFAIVR